MANMPNVHNRQIGLRPSIELCRKVEKKFAKNSDAAGSLAYIRALEEATRDVLLSAKDYQAIAREASANEAARAKAKGVKNV